jgi:hypothetical protein
MEEQICTIFVIAVREFCVREEKIMNVVYQFEWMA